MADPLEPLTPCAGLLPLSIGLQELVEVDCGPLTSLMPYAGRGKALSEALGAARGLSLPGPGETAEADGKRAIWFGRDQVLLMGVAPGDGLADHAAVVDQSDGWACVELSGPGAQAVLMRLVPVDLREAAFPEGWTARTQIGHMMGSVTRTGAERFLLMVFRSMARTLVHELRDAMETVAARS